MGPAEAALTELSLLNPEVVASALLRRDGTLLARNGSEEAGLVALGPLLAVVGARATAELGRGQIQGLLLEGDQGWVLVQPVDDDTVLAVVAQRGAAPGLLWSDVRACAARPGLVDPSGGVQ